MGKTVQTRSNPCGFTLIELLAVIATVAIVAMALLPAFAKTRFRAQEVTCLNNLRQMMVAWQNYADNNNGKFVLNPDGGMMPAWTGGNLANATDRTNTALITNGLLYRYAGSVSLYKCPGNRVDNSVRGISMNCFMGNPRATYSGNGLYQNYVKASSLNNLAQIFVFIDENEATINDGLFRIDGQTLSSAIHLNDQPAYYHNNGSGIAFADGHAEMHLWKGLGPQWVGDPATGIAVTGDALQDGRYLLQIATTPASGSW